MDFDLIASEYARHRKIMLPVLDGLRDFVAAIGHKAAVVELGSGTGNYIIALAESTGCMAWGIDCAKGMLAQAVSRGSEVQFAIGDATKLALAADRFDLVYSVDVIHHIGPTDRLVSYYQEARRVLKEGGRVCTVTHSEALLRSSGAEPLFPRGCRADRSGLSAYRCASRRYGDRRICRYRGKNRRPHGEGDQCRGLCGESLFRAEFHIRQSVRAGSAPSRGGSRHRTDPRHPAGADAVGHEAVSVGHEGGECGARSGEAARLRTAELRETANEQKARTTPGEKLATDVARGTPHPQPSPRLLEEGGTRQAGCARREGEHINRRLIFILLSFASDERGNWHYIPENGRCVPDAACSR